jgi:hypothetical protein
MRIVFGAAENAEGFPTKHTKHTKKRSFLSERRKVFIVWLCVCFELLSSKMLARREEFMATKSTKDRE